MTPLALTPGRCALVAIDLQKGIVGMASEPRPPGAVVANAARLAAALRGRGGFVVWVRVTASPDGRDLLRPVLDPGAPSFAGPRPPDWADLVPELARHPDDHVVTKRSWGAFYGTDLDLQLRRRGIDTIVLCGISTSIGVESTARDAYERGYQQIFAEDAMASRSAAEHEHTVTRVFPRIGRVRSTEQVLTALSAGA